MFVYLLDNYLTHSLLDESINFDLFNIYHVATIETHLNKVNDFGQVNGTYFFAWNGMKDVGTL